jgi:hypothetical protein
MKEIVKVVVKVAPMGGGIELLNEGTAVLMTHV